MSKERIRISSGTPWEPLIGYCRAIRVGNNVYVSGTTALDVSGEVVGVGDAYVQTRHIIEIIRRALQDAGANLSEVVRTRMFVTDISQWKNYSRAHREAFEKIRPTNTFVQVAKLIDPRMLIEMEVDALLG